jgi:hypothetical protein
VKQMRSAGFTSAAQAEQVRVVITSSRSRFAEPVAAAPVPGPRS